MASFKTMEALKKAVEKQLKENMEDHVCPIVSEQIKKSIQEVVYDVYSPTVYVRKKKRFMSDSNFRQDTFSIPNSVVTKIGHHAKTKKGKDLTTLIISGQARASTMDSGVARYNDSFIDKALERGNIGTPFWYPRDYMGHATQQLKSNGDVARELRRGFD